MQTTTCVFKDVQSRDRVSMEGFGLVIGFIELF
jgi:hypothetical protein